MNSQRQVLYPLNEQGYIDIKELYKVAYGRLGLPYNSLYEVSPLELAYILEGYDETKIELFEMFTMSTYSAINGAFGKGKFVNPFSRDQIEKKKKNKHVARVATKEQREKELMVLDEIFQLH